MTKSLKIKEHYIKSIIKLLSCTMRSLINNILSLMLRLSIKSTNNSNLTFLDKKANIFTKLAKTKINKNRVNIYINQNEEFHEAKT